MTRESERLVVVISDIEMGAGGVTDDFPQSEWLLEWLETLPDAPVVELVLNGDTFDFLKTEVDGTFPRHVDAQVALAKWVSILAFHAPFLVGLGRWLACHPHRNAHFVVGNHDMELVFEEVQDAVRAAIACPGRVHFEGFAYDIGELHIEHGQQTDGLFRVDPDALFLDYGGRRLLNLPWGSVALLDVALPHRDVLYHLDRLKPRARVFELVPEARKLASDAFWQYWTRDWWVDLLYGDPVKKVSWSLFKEVLYRMGSGNVDISPSEEWHARLETWESTRVWCVGHYHQAAWWEHADRKVLFTGAFRNEFAVEKDGRTGRQIANTFALFWLDGESVRVSELRAAAPPPVPDGYAPLDLATIRDAVRGRVAARGPVEPATKAG